MRSAVSLVLQRRPNGSVVPTSHSHLKTIPQRQWSLRPSLSWTWQCVSLFITYRPGRLRETGALVAGRCGGGGETGGEASWGGGLWQRPKREGSKGKSVGRRRWKSSSCLLYKIVAGCAPVGYVAGCGVVCSDGQRMRASQDPGMCVCMYVQLSCGLGQYTCSTTAVWARPMFLLKGKVLTR